MALRRASPPDDQKSICLCKLSPMKHSKPINTLTSHLVGHLVTERTPIHAYRKAIRTAKPYISFVYIDTDTLPTVTNIPLVRPSLYTRFIDNATRQPELHVLFRGDSRQGYDGQTPKIQAFTLDNQANSVEVTIPIGEQHVSLDATLNSKDQREIPVVQSLALGAQATAVEVTIPIGRAACIFGCYAQFKRSARDTSCSVPHAQCPNRYCSKNHFLHNTTAISRCYFNPYDQREKLVVRSLKQDVRIGSEEKTISIIQQKASLDVVFNLDKKHEELSTIPYALDHKPAQYTNTTTREEQQYDSYNHSLVIIEPRCSDYPVSKTRNRIRIVRYDRYSRANHIVSKQDKA